MQKCRWRQVKVVWTNGSWDVVWRSVVCDIVYCRITKMVRRYWSKFSHVPFAITAWPALLSQWARARHNLISDGRAFRIDKTAHRRTKSVLGPRTASCGVSEERRNRIGTTGSIRSLRLCWRWRQHHLQRQRCYSVRDSVLDRQLVEKPILVGKWNNKKIEKDIRQKVIRHFHMLA